jgi:Flp pilus assembly protein TadB
MADPSPARAPRPGRHPLSAVLIGAGLGVAVWLLTMLWRSGTVWPLVVMYVLVVALCIWLVWRDRRFARALRALDARRRDLGGWENMTDAQRVQWLADVQRVLDRL